MINTSKAAVCIVDLSQKEELAEKSGIMLRIDDQIRDNEEGEGLVLKNLPNVTNQKEHSPFKQVISAAGENPI